MFELVLGGARSGKSRHAESLAHESGLELHYIATAEAWDDEMKARIERHQQQRSAEWHIHECPLLLAEAIEALDHPGKLILVDCLTLWLTNQLMADPETVEDKRAALLDVLNNVTGRVVLVSNEVGQGVVPDNALSRRFIDEAGWLHQAIARDAQRVWWVVAGLPQCLKGEPTYGR
ncbi:bifunctional adenosylcobinamide kinase/adenosylcobinamide-phosphate guanylyltransferase [Cernens ardua]|uniref:bifunctional adenosylcobinamide kinase/adenosylcobinamide-phosphate guanylyltransferase n=1 Tax=Cernens ardua TaxID=3402176 RepID=UPI003F948040